MHHELMCVPCQIECKVHAFGEGKTLVYRSPDVMNG